MHIISQHALHTTDCNAQMCTMKSIWDKTMLSAVNTVGQQFKTPQQPTCPQGRHRLSTVYTNPSANRYGSVCLGRVGLYSEPTPSHWLTEQNTMKTQTKSHKSAPFVQHVTAIDSPVPKQLQYHLQTIKHCVTIGSEKGKVCHAPPKRRVVTCKSARNYCTH